MKGIVALLLALLFANVGVFFLNIIVYYRGEYYLRGIYLQGKTAGIAECLDEVNAENERLENERFFKELNMTREECEDILGVRCVTFY